VNPIKTVAAISTMTIKPSAEAASAKTEAASAEGAKAFSILLQSLADGAQHGEDQEAALPKALLKKIEDMLAELQEQPVEELTEAQQKLMYELMQLINSQPERKEGTILVDTGGRRKFTPIYPDPVEKQAISKDVQAKLVELVQKLGDILPGMSATDNKKFAAASPFVGVEGKATIINAENIEKITNKIVEFTESLAGAEKKSAAPVQPGQEAKLGVISAAETEKQIKVSGETKTANADEPEAVKAQPSAAAVTAARSDGGQQQETSQQDENKQSGTQPTASADSAKQAAAQTTQPLQARPEEPAMPTPVVRMNNLTEELGEVFKNSLRMTTNGESTQIKVNISPDNLGHLDIRLTETNGKIAAQIFTSSLAAKDAIDLQLNQLRNSLTQQGLTVEKIEVVQNNSQQSLDQQNAQSEQRFTQQQQQRQKSAGRDNNGYQQIEEKAAVERNHRDSGTMKVDYTV